MMLKMLSRHKGHYMTKALKNRTNCNVMLNAIQERKRYNGLVIISQWNIPFSPFQELIGDHFGVGEEKWGSF